MCISKITKGCYLTFIYTAISIITLSASTITQNAADALNVSSLNAGTNWSDGNTPSSGNDYTTSYLLRTPSAGGSYTFAGNSLTLNSGGVLAYKGTVSSSVTDVITVNNLYLKTGGIVTNYMPDTYELDGTVILVSGQTGAFQLSSGSYGMNVSSTISGSGRLSFTTTGYTSQCTYAIKLSGNNTFSGGSTIAAYAYVIGASSGAFGTGNINVNGGKLELQSASSIADSAKLILASSLADGSVYLNFSGTETVGSLSLNGGTSYVAGGAYTVSDLNTLYGSSVLYGTGQILVIPESKTLTSLLIGIGFLFSATFLYKFELEAINNFGGK